MLSFHEYLLELGCQYPEKTQVYFNVIIWIYDSFVSNGGLGYLPLHEMFFGHLDFKFLDIWDFFLFYFGLLNMIGSLLIMFDLLEENPLRV